MKDIYIGDRISNYQVNEEGRVFSKNRSIFLKEMTNKDGYKFVRIRMGSKYDYKFMFVHNLVMTAYVGSSDFDVNHKDGDKSNNNLKNLEYLTHSENVKHSYKSGLKKMKITKEDVEFIKNSKQTGVYLSKTFRISTAMVSLIKNNKTRTYGY